MKVKIRLVVCSLFCGLFCWLVCRLLCRLVFQPVELFIPLWVFSWEAGGGNERRKCLREERESPKPLPAFEPPPHRSNGESSDVKWCRCVCCVCCSIGSTVPLVIVPLDGSLGEKGE